MVKYRIWFTVTVACCMIVGSGGTDDYDIEYSTNDEGVIYDDFTDSTTHADEKIYNENYNSVSGKDKQLSFQQLNETVTTEGTTIETDGTTEGSAITTIITTTSTTEMLPSSTEDVPHVSKGSSGDDLTTMSSSQQDEEDTVTDSSLTWLNNIYNPHGWNMTPPGNVFGECRRQLTEYAAALLNGTTWAAKVTDASGHYSSQFFFGNDFWLGSHALCEELQNPTLNPIVPPFELRFHVARLSVNIKDFTVKAPRTVLLGLCLPRTCSSLDITRMLQSSNPVQGARSLRVLRVRAVPGPYRIIDDIKFHILGGVMAAMLLLMAVGTSYEMLLTRRTPLDTSVVCVPDAEAKRCPKMSGEHSKDKRTDLGERTDKEKDPRSGLPSRILLAFSALTNGRRILQATSAEDAITSIHGLRFLSLAWVILVHTYLEVFAIAENKTLRAVTERNLMFQTISNATFSVDSFFFISGLLLTYLYLRSLGSEKSPSGDGEQTMEPRTSTPTLRSSTTRFSMLVIYRFVRLTPAYLFVLGLVEVTTRWVHNNSVFEPNIIDQHTCDKYWWRNALYINSLFPRSEMGRKRTRVDQMRSDGKDESHETSTTLTCAVNTSSRCSLRYRGNSSTRNEAVYKNALVPKESSEREDHKTSDRLDSGSRLFRTPDMKVLVVILALTIALCYARPAEEKDNGDGVAVDVYDERGRGTVLHGSGQKTWESDDGKTEVKVYGDWSKVSNGPKAGPPQHKVGGSIRYKFDR